MNSSALAARFVSGPHITAASNAEACLGEWLAELELEGIIAEQIEVKAGSAGTVSVSATLARGGQ